MQQAGLLGTRPTFAYFGATVLDNFNLARGEYGTSFLKQLV